MRPHVRSLVAACLAALAMSSPAAPATVTGLLYDVQPLPYAGRVFLCYRLKCPAQSGTALVTDSVGGARTVTVRGGRRTFCAPLTSPLP